MYKWDRTIKKLRKHQNEAPEIDTLHVDDFFGLQQSILTNSAVSFRYFNH